MAEYAAAAHAVIDGLRSEGRAVIVEGGSGLYLQAALGDLEFAAPPDPALRRELEERWARDPDGVLDELRRRDPAPARAPRRRQPAARDPRPRGRAR